MNIGVAMRPGKTRREHANGAWARHLENQELRANWNREYMTASKGGGHKIIPYPKIGVRG